MPTSRQRRAAERRRLRRRATRRQQQLARRRRVNLVLTIVGVGVLVAVVVGLLALTS